MAAATLKRDKFFYMHLLRCKTCLKEWVEIMHDVPKERRNQTIERIVLSNHQGNSTLSP